MRAATTRGGDHAATDRNACRPDRCAFAARLRGCESGLAFVEFAMSLPVLVTLGLVGLETANLAMAHLRVSNIAMLTADNAARVRDSIDEANVIELLTGAKMTGDSIRFRQNGRIILSSVEPNTAGAGGTSTGQWIRWQRCDGAKNVRLQLWRRRAPARPTPRCRRSARRATRSPRRRAPPSCWSRSSTIISRSSPSAIFGPARDPLRKRVQRPPADQPGADQSGQRHAEELLTFAA